MLTCTNCGRENPDDARFCANCGSPLEGPVTAREERKVVTVLFADLVGFTSRSERLDPEDVRATLTPYFARLRKELERRGGTVEKFIGDAVMAVFGAPVAHEDDPERAVRAALAIREAVGEMNEQDPELDLHVRIGITTGDALVSLGADPLQGEGMAAGDVVNTAARLQGAAPVDGVLVGEMTYRSTERAIEYRPASAVEAKGKSTPVPVWEAIQATSRHGVDITRRVDTPLVGRERELALLKDALERVRLQSEPQLVTIVGEPGIGKSRLVHELYEHVESFPDLITWRQGRSLPYGAGVSYWALGEIVKAEAGILETDADVETAGKLDRMVGELIREEDELAWVVRHLRPLIGLAHESAAGQEGSDEARAAWRRLLEALAERRPTVLILEDLHWADDHLLDFLDYLLDWTRDVPLLVIGTARPELLTQRPGWGGGKPNTFTISLAPLSDEETARILASLMERALLPAELQSALLARASGNPLYAEEFARMAEGRTAADLSGLDLPDTVQGIIAARLDGLDPADKTLLQDAAVIGKAFWLGAVAAIGGGDPSVIEDRSHGLERGRFVRRARRSSVGGENEYAFLHVLVRDVAYGQIPRAARAQKHRSAAEWIASLSADRLEDRAELLAHHYLSALELSRAAGVPTSELERPARLALRAAGERAVALGAYAAAERAFRSAVELWPLDDPERASVLFEYGRTLWLYRDAGVDILSEARDLLLAAGDVEKATLAELHIGDMVWRRGQGKDAQEHFARAEKLIEGRPPSIGIASAKAHLCRYLMVTGRFENAVRVGREALVIAEGIGDDEITTFALNSVGTARIGLGDMEGFDDIERSIAVAERANLHWHILRNNVNLGVSLYNVGDVRRALEVHQGNLELAQRVGMVGAIHWNLAEVAADLVFVGRWDEALEILDPEIVRIERAPHYMEGQHRLIRARVREGRGDGAGAMVDADRAVDVGRTAGDPQALLPAMSERARVLLLLGRTDEAAAATDEILRFVDSTESLEDVWWVVQTTLVLSATGRADEALRRLSARGSRWASAARAWAAGELAAAADHFHEIGVVPDEAYALLRLAEQLIDEGRRAEADPYLARARELYSTMGATPYVARAEQLLATSA
ncbi:MAG TPA: adenylate/guanylate cyclase domain-containing protein [Actinomycetota bacterium]|nr:adenylate/guanylate cyclase domain-containing protein [Actinomycetota bacterium]